MSEAEKARRGQRHPAVIINSMLVAHTVTGLEQWCQELAGLGVARRILTLPMFTTPDRGARYAARLKGALDVEADSWTGFLSADADLDANHLTAALTRAFARHPRGTFHLNPVGRLSRVRPWFESPGESFGRRRCHALYSSCNVRPDGEVVLCNDLPDVVLGNVLEAPFEEIWNGEPARRRRIRRTGDGRSHGRHLRPYSLCPLQA